MCNAKDCEQYHPDNICCTCQNLEWYKLKQTLTEIKEYLKPYLCKGGVEPQWVEWQMAQREKEKMAKDIFQILQRNQRGGE